MLRYQADPVQITVAYDDLMEEMKWQRNELWWMTEWATVKGRLSLPSWSLSYLQSIRLWTEWTRKWNERVSEGYERGKGAITGSRSPSYARWLTSKVLLQRRSTAFKKVYSQTFLNAFEVPGTCINSLLVIKVLSMLSVVNGQLYTNYRQHWQDLDNQWSLSRRVIASL